MACGCARRALKLLRWLGWEARPLQEWADRAPVRALLYERPGVSVTLHHTALERHHVRLTLLGIAVRVLTPQGKADAE